MSEQQMNDSTFSRLFILMIIAMTVLTAILMVLASFASSDVNTRLDERAAVENTAALAERIAPVGEFAVATSEAVETANVEPVVLSGVEAYASCAACHGAGIAGAPAVGDQQAWSLRLSKGIETLYSNAIQGYQGEAGYMPAKGGNSDLSDQSVRNAVDYMVGQSE